MAEKKGNRKGSRPGVHYQKGLWGEQGHQVLPPPGTTASQPPDQRRKVSPNVTAPSLWEPAPTLTAQPSSPTLPGSESAQTNAGTAYPEAEPAPAGTNAPSTGNETFQLRQRVQRRGVSSLSNAELMSVALHADHESESVLARMQTLLTSYSLQQLLSIDFGLLREQYGLSEAKAAQLQAMLEVARRLTIPAEVEEYTIRSVLDAVNLVRPEMEYLDHEEMRELLLDTRLHVVSNLLLYQGTINSSVLRTAEIYLPAITRKCPNVIIFHNHPGGDPEPSNEDIAVTKQLVEAGKLLEVELVDHIIIGHNHRYVSLKERIAW